MNRFYETSELAENNVKYRPIYTSEIAECVVKFYRQYNPRSKRIELMYEAGCGTGQSANVFQPFCDKIIACDISQEQLKQARLQNKFKNVYYQMGGAEKIKMGNKSVDLVVSGMSAHWFDFPKFFDESKRILKPSGCLSIFGYDIPEISLLGTDGNKTCKLGTNLLRSLLVHAASECPVSLSALISIQSHYDDMFEALPFSNKMRIDDIHVVTKASINDICGYIRSIHLRQNLLNRRIEEMEFCNIPITQKIVDFFDISIQFKSLIRKLWNLNDVNDDAKIFKLDFPFFVLLAKS